MNNKEFISELSSRMGYSTNYTQRLVTNIVNDMGDSLMEGDAIQVPNFGTFEVKKKMERVMVNPSTGQRMLVPPKLVLGFKPSATWKDKIKNGGQE
jgi:DNA-binding protein HU-beta/integration host factor subunit alpha